MSETIVFWQDNKVFGLLAKDWKVVQQVWSFDYCGCRPRDADCVFGSGENPRGYTCQGMIVKKLDVVYVIILTQNISETVLEHLPVTIITSLYKPKLISFLWLIC